jgi:hypothetical protein
MRAIDRIMAAACAVSLASCTLSDPYRFDMHAYSGWPIDGRIEGDYHRVDQPAPNVLDVNDGATVAMRVPTLTDGAFSVETTMRDGAHATFYIRTTPYDRTNRRNEGIVLTVTPEQTTLTMETGASVRMPTPFDRGRPSVVEIVNDGRFVDVTVACTRVARLPTSLPSTEWIIVAPSAGASVELIDPRFRPLYDND